MELLQIHRRLMSKTLKDQKSIKGKSLNKIQNSIQKIEGSRILLTGSRVSCAGKIIRNQSLKHIPDPSEDEKKIDKKQCLSGSRIVKNKGSALLNIENKFDELKTRKEELKKRKELNDQLMSSNFSSSNILQSQKMLLESKNALKKISSTKHPRISLNESSKKIELKNFNEQRDLKENPSKDLKKYEMILDKFTQERKKIVDSIRFAFNCKNTDKYYPQTISEQQKDLNSQKQAPEELKKDLKLQTRSTTFGQSNNSQSSQKMSQQQKQQQIVLRTSLKTLSLKVIQNRNTYQNISLIQENKDLKAQLNQNKLITTKYVLQRNLWHNKYIQLKQDQEGVQVQKTDELKQKYKKKVSQIKQLKQKMKVMERNMLKNKQQALQQCSNKQKQIRNLKQRLAQYENSQNKLYESKSIISKISFISSCQQIIPPSELDICN